jgi:hypothetical protein
MEMDNDDWMWMTDDELRKGNLKSPRTPMADLRTANLQDKFY